MTTFCALLKYVYVELNVVSSQYLICDMDCLKVEPSIGLLNESLKDNNPGQLHDKDKDKDKVTWPDILLAADRFEITGLRK